MKTALVVSALVSAACSVLATATKDLKIEITKKVPCVRKSRVNDVLHVHYKGILEENNQVFDSSWEKESGPLIFELGAGQVIKGWDQGLLDMCVGEQRKLTIPPELAYGKNGAGSIPADATLIFETELVKIMGVNADEAGGDKVAGVASGDN